jgi:hypothetical protein
MNGILNIKIREFIRDKVHSLNKKYDYISDEIVTVDGLNYIFEKNSEVREQSLQKALKNLDKQISSSNLLTCCLFTLACSVYSEKEIEGILPKQWISINGKPDPKHVFGFPITQLCQFAISVIELAEKGLDNAARVVLRSFIELTWQLIILLYYREDLKKYVVPEEQNDVNRVWWELFGKGKIQKKLSAIEENLGFDSETREKYSNYRKDIYQFFSESVHHSHINSIVSSVIWNFHEDSGAWTALGGAGLRSDATLTTLTTSGLYFLDMFFMILEDYHGTDICELDYHYFKDCLVFRDCLWEIVENRLKF